MMADRIRQGPTNRLARAPGSPLGRPVEARGSMLYGMLRRAEGEPFDADAYVHAIATPEDVDLRQADLHERLDGAVVGRSRC